MKHAAVAQRRPPDPTLIRRQVGFRAKADDRAESGARVANSAARFEAPV